MNRMWQQIKEGWPVIVVVATIVSVLVGTWTTVQMQAIAKDAITEAGQHPAPKVTALETAQALTDQKAEVQAAAIVRVEATVIRVEGKLDDLMLLLQQRIP